ncbi:hypothetical protein [Streptomyces sp. NPDC047061]|uniref:hypothetical protein n=1 Tax=Streptomyces sp. NPDC047061 TaxID=3154605 RepID=UPI0033EADBB1
MVAKGVPKSALPPPATAVVHAAGALAGAAKAVSGEILRVRRAQDRWAGASTTEAAARLDELFDELTAWSDRFTEAVTDQAEARFEARSADIAAARTVRISVPCGPRGRPGKRSPPPGNSC